MINLEACTDEELEQKLARVLAYASGEVLNDAEVQEFHQFYEEIVRREVEKKLRTMQADEPPGSQRLADHIRRILRS